jgi:hypothetical protein
MPGSKKLPGVAPKAKAVGKKQRKNAQIPGARMSLIEMPLDTLFKVCSTLY